MESPLSPALEPANLPPGTKVGPWRVECRSAQGTYGTIYRAVSSGQDEPVPIALKLALHPEDPRFSREAALLARLDHPSIPLILDHSRWRHSSGAPYPYITMAWIEGTPLYDWAREHNPTSLQVLRVLSHLARALQVVHRAAAVHRDVKGDNMLVRPSDGRLFLTDFGTGYFAGTARLTPMPLLPGTPAYRSPEITAQRAHPAHALTKARRAWHRGRTGRGAGTGRCAWRSVSGYAAVRLGDTDALRVD